MPCTFHNKYIKTEEGENNLFQVKCSGIMAMRAFSMAYHVLAFATLKYSPTVRQGGNIYTANWETMDESYKVVQTSSVRIAHSCSAKNNIFTSGVTHGIAMFTILMDILP